MQSDRQIGLKMIDLFTNDNVCTITIIHTFIVIIIIDTAIVMIISIIKFGPISAVVRNHQDDKPTVKRW